MAGEGGEIDENDYHPQLRHTEFVNLVALEDRKKCRPRIMVA